MDILREFLDKSTIHGLAHISDVSSKAGKVLWATVVIAGFCTAGFLIQSSYEEWETTPVATSISTHPIAALPLPIITICPPEQSNTALNVDLVRAGNISLTDSDRQALINVSRHLFIHEPSMNFVDLARRLTNKEDIPQLMKQTRSYPTPYENTDRGSNMGFEIWSTELEGSYKSPGFGSRRICSGNDPNIHFTLYIPQKVAMKEEDLTGETFNIDIVALNDDEFEIEYREGGKYIFHDKSSDSTYWSDAENRCNEQRGHLVSIHTNYDFILFKNYQQRENKKRKRAWLGGNDRRTEGVWDWSDGTPWSNEYVANCRAVDYIPRHGLKNCTNWEKKHPAGGKEQNCLIVERSHKWMSYNCESKKMPYWCHIPPTRFEGNKGLSWRLADTKFSQIELWLTKKTVDGARRCNGSGTMPGFLVTWSTNNADGGSNTSKVFTVPEILKTDEQDYYQRKIENLFKYLNFNLRYTVVACRKVNMTTQEIWGMVQSHKRELVEGNIIGCSLGLVRSDDFRKLITGLKAKIPRDSAKMSYSETADDHALTFEIFSYLLFCQREQIEMAAFYNNLFHTANPGTILQATVNNIQLGVKKADTMVALHEIYKMLAKKMELKLPLILQGFFGSKMRGNFDQNMEINNGLNDEQTELPHPGKYLSKFDKLGSSGSNAHRA